MKTCDVCGASNPADSRFCASCGSPLAAVCRRCGAPLPEAARFCPACGEPVEPAAAPGTERKLVTVVFADVTGSTTLGEQLDPERLREVLDACFSAMRQEIEAEGGPWRRGGCAGYPSRNGMIAAESDGRTLMS